MACNYNFLVEYSPSSFGHIVTVANTNKYRFNVQPEQFAYVFVVLCIIGLYKKIH